MRNPHFGVSSVAGKWLTSLVWRSSPSDTLESTMAMGFPVSKPLGLLRSQISQKSHNTRLKQILGVGHTIWGDNVVDGEVSHVPCNRRTPGEIFT